MMERTIEEDAALEPPIQPSSKCFCKCCTYRFCYQVPTLRELFKRDRRLMRAIFVIVLLLNVPIGRFILYPFILFWTWIHELFHGLAAISVGGKIDWLNIYPDGSGLAYTVIPDGIFQRVWVAAAGYQGIAIVGGILLMFRRTALGVRVGTCGIGLIMLLSCILFVIWFGCIGTDRAAVDISRIVSYTIWNCNNVSQRYYINRNVVFCHGIQYWWSKSIIRCNNDDARFNKDTVSVVGFNLIGIGVLDDSLWGFHCPRLKMMITALLLNQTMANWLKAFRRFIRSQQNLHEHET
jgi:hypothetical protein